MSTTDDYQIDAASRDESVYRRIKRAILENRLPPGTKLTEETLSALFEVSRERIRKVLHRLSYDKCVDLKRNRGAFVAQPDAKEAQDVFATRLILEPTLAHLVIENAEPEDYSELEKNIASEQAMHADNQLNEAIALSGEFHMLLARAGGNLVITEILRDLIARSSLIIAMYGWRQYSLCGYEKHLSILHALRDADGRRAEVLMREHLEELRARLQPEPYPVQYVDLEQVFSDRIARQPADGTGPMGNKF